MEQFAFNLPIEQHITIDNASIGLLTEHGTNRKGPPSVQSLHTHSYAEIFMCTMGTLTIITETGRYQAGEGEGFFVPPQVMHYQMRNETIERKHFGLSIKRIDLDGRDLYTKLMARFGGKVPLHLADCSRLRALTESVETAEDVQTAFELTALLAELYRCVEQSEETRMPANLPDFIDQPMILKLEGLLNTYYNTDINAEKLSALLNISERQLARIVKRHYGRTLRRVIMDRRLVTSTALLVETNKSAESIGRSVGFGTNASFYREFRQTYGITPMEYRRLYGRNE